MQGEGGCPRATPNFHAGTHLAYKDTAYESYRTRWEEHLAAHAPPPQPAARGRPEGTGSGGPSIHEGGGHG